MYFLFMQTFCLHCLWLINKVSSNKSNSFTGSVFHLSVNWVINRLIGNPLETFGIKPLRVSYVRRIGKFLRSILCSHRSYHNFLVVTTYGNNI